MARFYFTETDDAYFLSNSLGEGVSVVWRKKNMSLKEALTQSDIHVGEYIRNFAPREVKYILQLKESTNAKVGNN